MANKNRQKVFIKIAVFIIALFFLIKGFIVSKTFFAPLFIAFILMLLVLPLCNKLENWGCKRAIASILTTLVTLLVSLSFFLLVSVQLNNVSDNWGQIKSTMLPKIEKASTYLVENTPLPKEKITDFKNQFSTSELIGTDNTKNKIFSFVSSFFGFLGQYLLVFIYIFFLLNFRKKFKKFILELFSKDKKSELTKTIKEIIAVAQRYLVGKLKLISLLAILYSIGLGISGVNNFLLVALIAAILTLIPYLGNMIGFGLALIFGYLTQGEVSILIGIMITFSLAQFVESYILQPYIVGDEVDLNPFFIILSVILGNLIWGITGMVIAIPVLAIINVVFLHIPSLKAVGNLLSKSE